MRNYKYELIFKETILDEDTTIEHPQIISSAIVDDNILNGFSKNHNAATIHLVRRLFAELLKKLI